jgi:hypothetical protein
MKKILPFIAILCILLSAMVPARAQVAINADGSGPHTSAMLDVKSTTKGLLIPRMTTAQRTTLGAIATGGLMVYDTDLNRYYFHNGSGWEIAAFGDFWSANGTSAFYATDITDLVGIGTTNPARKLEVSGGWQTARLTTTSSGPSLEFMGSSATDWSIAQWSNTLRLLSSTDGFSSTTDQFSFSEIEFIPWTTNSKTLGSTAKRWSTVYGTNAGFTGDAVIGGTSYLGKLHVHDGVNHLATLYVTPASTGSGDSSMVFLSEDDMGYYGMYWLYEGFGNDLELYGKAGTVTYGPHMQIDRTTGNIAFGSTYATGYRLSVEGKIICTELRVNLVADWPDYVFKQDYQLMPLDRLGAFIQKNGHLPNVPPASEIEKSGLEVGEMQRLMMEKIEELSLYILKQQEQINALQDQIDKDGK